MRYFIQLHDEKNFSQKLSAGQAKTDMIFYDTWACVKLGGYTQFTVTICIAKSLKLITPSLYSRSGTNKENMVK